MGKVIWTLVVTLAVVLVLGWLFLASGFYDVGADRGHTVWVYAALNTLKSRSIEARAREVRVPTLGPARLAEGAEHYSAMCTGCHLAPGLPETEIRQGLLPKPPDLSQTKVDPAQAFWVIKHGIKASAMPAWGQTHDDEEIWNIVAFLEKLPSMSREQYRAMTAESADAGDTDHDSTGSEHHEHAHHHEM